MRKKSAKTDQAKIREISAPHLLQRVPSLNIATAVNTEKKTCWFLAAEL